jgi:hypothetical protein
MAADCVKVAITEMLGRLHASEVPVRPKVRREGES